MAEPGRLPSWFFPAVGGYLIVSTAIVAAVARGFWRPSQQNPAEAAIEDSAFFPVVMWLLGWPIAVQTRVARFTRARRFAVFTLRWVWSLGCLLCLLHIALAFHLGHGWSHSAAREHTRQVSGFGFGVYVNYLFALVWVVDVVWAWSALDSYRARPAWLNGTIHGFLAFIVFNAVVVFGSAETRSRFAPLFVAVGVLLLGVRRMTRTGTRAPANPESGVGDAKGTSAAID